jgi:UDP:flavonoid glycosyltransferase YjiC (YdhE family)
MPRCALIVHQGGIGTTAQALRSGKPAIVVPQSHDQPDNGARIERLHTGRVIRKADYQARHVNHAIHGILQDSTYSAAARVLGKEITAENGVAAACDEIERVLGKS